LKWLLLAVFMLFSTWGFFADTLNGGRQPYAEVLLNSALNGLVAALWIIVLARFPLVFIAGIVALSLLNPLVTQWLDRGLVHVFRLHYVDGQSGIVFASTGTMVAIVISYVLFVTFIRKEGKEAFRLRNELELAHGIQKTLVPPFTLRTARYEVYGISKPSEKVGGDLVDAVTLSNGDAIAYLGDIAGHGLQAGILMGMLKTATRTALSLLDAAESDPHSTLPVLLDRLNAVLPGVKEAHMYATFSAFRLCADGTTYYALAASPPVLHWHANGLGMSRMAEEQFPLGLLDVSRFDGSRVVMKQGDLLAVATDGILEVCDQRGEEFGEQRLEQTVAAHAGAALPDLAERILDAARNFGRQVDDQTILLIRYV
jgi:serine phosphatase RsbU (regulator of sigma subunit)